MELFEQQTPKTFANFLSYVNNGRYKDSIFHRSVPGFIVQAGGFKIANNDDGVSVTRVDTFDPVINEFSIPNTRGTVAMAKLPGDPNSATSQWFVNLSDNTAILDNQNGGFTVFGRVINDGIMIFDAIAKLPITNFGKPLDEMPTIDFDSTSGAKLENFVQISNVEVANPVGIFSEDELEFTVIVDDGNFFDVKLRLIESAPNFIFELDFDNITALQTTQTDVATFSTEDSVLNIPSVMVNDAFFVHNVTMALTDASSFQFTLLSLE